MLWRNQWYHEKEWLGTKASLDQGKSLGPRLKGWETDHDKRRQKRAHPFLHLHLQQFSQLSWVAQSCPTLRPHKLQHARPPYPSPTPGVHSNSCPSSWWCHPAISSSVVPFSSCPQSLPASRSFQWVNSSHEVAKVMDFQPQHQSFQWTPRTGLL